MTATSAAFAPFDSSVDHLDAEMAWLELVLQQRVVDMRSRRGSEEPFDEFAGTFVSEQEIARYLSDRDGGERTTWDPRALQLGARIASSRGEIDARVAASIERGDQLRLPRLARRFRLSQPELRVLLCCLSPDWGLRFQRYFAYLQNDVSRRRPTIQLLVELCGDDGGSATTMRALFSPDAPLVRERLVTIGAADLPLPARQPAVAEVVSDYLAGTVTTEPRLAGIVSIHEPKVAWPSGIWYERHRTIVASLATALARDGRLSTAYIAADEEASRSLITSTVAAIAGARLMRVECRAWLAAGTVSRDAVRWIRRDAILHRSLVELTHCEALLDPAAADVRIALNEFLAENQAAGILLTGTAACTDVSSLFSASIWNLEIPRPNLAERENLWRHALAARGREADAESLELLSAGFRFTPSEMRRALDAYEASRDCQEKTVDRGTLLRACRETSRRSMQRFARLIVPRRGWDDLVLPEDSRVQLREICDAARGRRRVHDDWGFARTLRLGSGLNVLFAGPSGVGKTMSAEVLAGDLGRDLFAIDLSSVVSKYIGETEKNLAAVFDEAEATNCVLFFDECDALFGKRTEIKDAHDRYANIEVSYLLQRIDQYEGIVILATNLRSNLDAAFTRRIRYAVEFPFPEAQYREHIWRRVFPPEAPVGDDVDLEFLARQFKLTGGSIANIAVNAAFLAASNGGRVGMKQVIHATRRELQKMGKSCTKAEFGKYFPWVRDTAAHAATVGASVE